MTKRKPKLAKAHEDKYTRSNWIFYEYLIWFTIVILFLLGDIIELIGMSYDIWEFSIFLFTRKTSSLITAIVILIFPVLFKFVFDEYPIFVFRNWIRDNYSGKMKIKGDDEGTGVKNKKVPLHEKSPLEYLQQLIEESDDLANKIYNRSNTYLFVGSLIALIGILYFSFQISDEISSRYYQQGVRDLTQSDLILELSKISSENDAINTSISEISEAVQRTIHRYEFNEQPDLSYYVIKYLPRLGALFFIEFIAFFFLKQYRASMDEFKYYESIKRNREEINFKIKYMKESKDENNLEVMKELILFNSNPGILRKEETTELIEKRKLSKEEVGIMEKLLDTITKLKGN